MKKALLTLSILYLAIGMLDARAQTVKQELQQKLAAVKESVATNQAALRQYSWTEHTDMSLKGEVKKSTDMLCRYGGDGHIVKTPIGTPAPKKEMRGLKKKMAEKKADEIQDYMERAASLIHRYMPPSTDAMQLAFQAGKVSIGQAGPGMVQLRFRDYAKPGDSLTLSFNSAAKKLTNVQVNTYLDDPKADIVTLAMEFQSLPDGTNYVASTTLNASAKQVGVKTTNANYQKLAK